MDLVMRFGAALLGMVLLLYAVLFLITRIYIHSLKKRIEATHQELVAVQSELNDLKATLGHQSLIYKPAQEMDTVQVQ